MALSDCSTDVFLMGIKILAINIFIILENCSKSCVIHIYADLKQIQIDLEAAGKPILPNIFVECIFAFLIMQYIFVFLGIAGHVIALYPILKMHQPDLLLPSMYTLLIQNVILKFVELIIGMAMCHFGIVISLIPCKLFCVKVLFKIFIALYIL